jgi:CheY-like chemotaxis protein
VKHLTELHGGEVRADSPGEGRGATFTIVLPAGRSAPAGDVARPIDSQATYQVVSLHSLRILIVEDEPDTRDFLLRLLASQGAEVRGAASATEALALFETNTPDILISDIGLPDVDGYDLIHRLRERERLDGRSVPAIGRKLQTTHRVTTTAEVTAYASILLPASAETATINSTGSIGFTRCIW